ncbi:MAG TPA: cupin domain-containing protein [Fulvivirga sp.]|nr:cupin domain-containing protein [Fulvivirga sp.]
MNQIIDMEHQIKISDLEWTEGNVKGFLGKQLIDQKNGTFKLVKVNPKTSYPLHRHPDKTEFAYVIEGHPEFEIDSDQYQSKVGDFFIFPIGKRHAIRNNTEAECQLLVGAIME